MGLVLFMVTLTTVAHVFSNIVSGFTKNPECGKSVGCYSDCDRGSCGFEMTFAKKGDSIEFTLKKSSLLPTVSYWIALGFSKDTKMGDDSVTECVDEGNTVEVYNSMNVAGAKWNQRLSANSKLGITKLEGSKVNGILSCKFRRNILSLAADVWSLNQAYYILLATGIDNNGSKLKHQSNPLISPLAISVDFKPDVSNAATIPLINANVLTVLIGVTLGKFKTHDYTIWVVVAYAIYQVVFF